MKTKTFCQSCGMPLETAGILATNADGSPNEEYCIHCYKDGAFTSNCSMQEMIDTSLAHMKELFAGDPSFHEGEAREKMNAFFPGLGRWKT